jgi:recombination protein RecT
MQELSIFDAFKVEFDSRALEIAKMLPPTVTREMFLTCALTAVKANLALLRCDRASLHVAITEAAQDGLLPDGDLAVIVPRKGKACYQAMYKGLIKRADEIGGVRITGCIVRERDTFDFDMGDLQAFRHTWKLGQDRGNFIGAWASFSRGREVLHREIMDLPDIEKVRSVSAFGNAEDGPWQRWYEPMALKTALHRGAKYAPLGSDIARIITRDANRSADLTLQPVTPQAMSRPLDVALPHAPITHDDIAQAMPQPRYEPQHAPTPVRQEQRQPRQSLLTSGFGPVPPVANPGLQALMGRRMS